MEAATKKIHRILLIDDDPEELLILEAAISEIDPTIELSQIKGYSRDLQSCGIDNFDLLFLDVNMPLMDGFEWLTHIRAAGYNIPVIMYSTTLQPARINKAYEMGATMFLPKPDSLYDLVKSLRTILQLNWANPQEITLKLSQNGSFIPFSIVN